MYDFNHFKSTDVGSCCLSVTCRRAHQRDSERTSEQMAHFTPGLNCSGPHYTILAQPLGCIIEQIKQRPSPTSLLQRHTLLWCPPPPPPITCDFYDVTWFSAKPLLRLGEKKKTHTPHQGTRELLCLLSTTFYSHPATKSPKSVDLNHTLGSGRTSASNLATKPQLTI